MASDNSNGFTAKIEDGCLVLRLRLQKPTPSASGKTLVVASTRGNRETEARVDGRQIVVGVNAYLRLT